MTGPFGNGAEFWNEVFRKGDRSYVKDRSADETIGMLSMVGPFEEELAEARSVLDVGPGQARLLWSLSQKNRYAIEVSELNRERLRSFGIDAVEPGYEKYPIGTVDLAWSVSCFPHVPYEGQKVLLEQVARALRPGGVFYLEHVAQRHDYPDVGEEHRLPAGRFWQFSTELADKAHGFGLTWTNEVSREFGKNCPLTGYFLRLVRE